MINKIKMYTSLIISFVFLFLTTGVIWAADLTITCTPSADDTKGTCSSSGGALFNEANLVPGNTIKRTIDVINEDNEGCNLQVKAKNITQSGIHGNFADKLFLAINDEITEVLGAINSSGEATDVTSLSRIMGTSWVSLGSFDPKETRTYTWVVTFDKDADNDYQNNKVSFDFDLDFACGASFSGSSASSAGGTTSAVAGAATRLLGKYLGASTEEVVMEEPGEIVTPEVHGASCTDTSYIWWLSLVVEALLFAIYYFWLNKKRMVVKHWYIIPFVIFVASQAVHEILGCNCSTGNWCSKYLYLNLIIPIIFLAADHLRKRVKKS